MRVLFMGGKNIGYEICQFLMAQDIQLKAVINDYEQPGDWYKTPRSLKGLEEIQSSEIRKYKPDLIIVAFYDNILKEGIFNLPQYGTWNLHLGDADKYRGAYPNIWALHNGDDFYAVTLHKVDSGIDTGPILDKWDFPISEETTGKELYGLMVQVAYEMFVHNWEVLQSGKANDYAKPSSGYGRTYYRKDLMLDLTIHVPDELMNMVRARTFPPFPPPHFYIGSKKFKIVQVE